MKNFKVNIIVVLFTCAMLAGCKNPNDDLMSPASVPSKIEKDYLPDASAGVSKDVTKSMDVNRLKGLVASAARFRSRGNPFALNASELKFDRDQASEKLLSEGGDFGTAFELPEDKAPEVVVEEAQPYRRLSGIVVGDAVYAILEQGGKSFIIKPGDRIPDSDWRVVSIDKNKAVLRRDGNVKPNEIEVRIEVIPPFLNQGGAGAPSQGGRGAGGKAGPSGSDGAGN
jgi:hypothetical protein